MTAPASPKELTLTGGDAPALTPFEVIERVIASGDLGSMEPEARIAFYWRTCESLGLNPLTRPFEFINLNGKLTLYARKDATDQLRKLNAVNVTEIRREKDEALGLVTVFARGRDRTGREDEATGVVNIKGLGGEALANALMKAETKAKRRLTLSIVGLGFLDESEVEGLPRDVDPDTGEPVAKPTLLEEVQAQAAALEAQENAETDELEREAMAKTAEDSATATETAAVETEGDSEWLDAAETVDLKERILAAAPNDQAATEKATAAQLEDLARIFSGWDRELVTDGFRAIFGRARPNAVQADAVKLVHADVGPVRFLAGWRAMLEESASS